MYVRGILMIGRYSIFFYFVKFMLEGMLEIMVDWIFNEN